MSVQIVKDYLKQWNKARDVQEFSVSSATVQLAAAALGVEPARIAKSITFKKDEGCLLVVAAGDAKIDNAKFKAQFGGKPRMLTAEEVFAMTGYNVGGVCPFALPEGVSVFLDVSLKRFTTVFPACGSSNSCIELTLAELETYSSSQGWVDVCKNWME
jgi:prolyl-tRNA editing enzyme YbaK/EbsC (Cys-tRNA(Pro) deacylase)